VHPNDPDYAPISRAAAAVEKDSPAYETTLYHRIRLLLEAGKTEQARKLLDENTPLITNASPSNRNAFLAQRFAVAVSFQEFLKFAPRTPVEIIDKIGKYDYSCSDGSCYSTGMHAGGPNIPTPQRLELDSAGIFNQSLPLSMLVKAANGKILPPELRDQLAFSTWLRGAILDKIGVTHELQGHVLTSYPELRSYLEDYDRSASFEARQFAIVFMLLHYPGMQPFIDAEALGSPLAPGIDSYSSWWCKDVGLNQEGGNDEKASNQGALFDSVTGNPVSPSPKPNPPLFLTAEERSQAHKEWTQLAEIGAAPNYFAPVVLNWAKTHPDDPRVPEALHFFVRATRFGCVDAPIGAQSKRAFDLLHLRYPDSSWAKTTPYWFGSR
jgi:hypothetical protein